MLNNINMVLDYILAINGFDSQYVYFPLSKTKIIEEIIWKISLPEFSSHFPQTKTYTNCKLEPVNNDPYRFYFPREVRDLIEEDDIEIVTLGEVRWEPKSLGNRFWPVGDFSMGGAFIDMQTPANMVDLAMMKNNMAQNIIPLDVRMEGNTLVFDEFNMPNISTQRYRMEFRLTHKKDFTTMTTALINEFKDLVNIDFKIYMWDNHYKYLEGLNTSKGQVNLKMASLEEAKQDRKDLIEKFRNDRMFFYDNTYVTR